MDNLHPIIYLVAPMMRLIEGRSSISWMAPDMRM